MNKTSDLLTKIAFSGMLIALLNFLCTHKSTPQDFKINPEKFRPFQPLGSIQPETYEEVIKIAFQKMSSGEQIPDLNSTIKIDITPEESQSLKSYILSQIINTIKTLPTPTKAAPMIGEEFSIIDLTGYFVKNTAVMTFTLFHKRRYFAINCRVIAQKNTSPQQPNSPPWFIHKIQYASEDIYDKTSNVKGFPYNKNIGTKVKPKVLVENVGYPETLEPILKQLQDLIPPDDEQQPLSTLSQDSKAIVPNLNTMNYNNLSDAKTIVPGNMLSTLDGANADMSNITPFSDAMKNYKIKNTSGKLSKDKIKCIST